MHLEHYLCTVLRRKLAEASQGISAYITALYAKDCVFQGAVICLSPAFLPALLILTLGCFLTPTYTAYKWKHWEHMLFFIRGWKRWYLQLISLPLELESRTVADRVAEESMSVCSDCINWTRTFINYACSFNYIQQSLMLFWYYVKLPNHIFLKNLCCCLLAQMQDLYMLNLYSPE